MMRRIIFATILLSACTRTQVAPSVEPPQVAVEIARPSSGAVLVPRVALISVDPAAPSAVVCVVKGDRAVRRSVAIGATVGDDIEIVSGVAAGEEVVTRGAANLRDGDRVRTVSRSGV